MNLIKITLLGLIVVWLAGCASVNAPTPGPLYTQEQYPVLVGNNTDTTKTGTACAKNILGIATGDASLETAKKNGGITKVASVDAKAKSFFGFYARYCTVVHGN